MDKPLAINCLSELIWTITRNMQNKRFSVATAGAFPTTFICAERTTEVMRLNVTGIRNNDLEILTYGKLQGWSGAANGIFGKRWRFLRSRVRQGYELLLSSLTDLVSAFLEEHTSHLYNRRLDSAHVNLAAVSTSSGMCERLPTSLFRDYDTTINFLLLFFITGFRSLWQNSVF